MGITYKSLIDGKMRNVSVDAIINNYTKKENDFLVGKKIWEECHMYFMELHNRKIRNLSELTDSEKDFACRTLAFYLASCGEYENNPFLKQYDSSIFVDVINKLLEERYDTFWEADIQVILLNQYARDDFRGLHFRIREILDDYENNLFDNLKKRFQKIAIDSNNLAAQILFVTMCCYPSYNKYFVIGLDDSLYKDINNYGQLLQEISLNHDFEDASKKHNIPLIKVADIYYTFLGKKIANEVSDFERCMYIF